MAAQAVFVASESSIPLSYTAQTRQAQPERSADADRARQTGHVLDALHAHVLRSALLCSALVEMATGPGLGVENTRFLAVFGLTHDHRSFGPRRGRTQK